MDVSVYVGPSNYPLGRMVMCHMVADSLTELHRMADRLDLKMEWFQSDGRRPHYDISMGKRVLAVELGAIETGERKIVEVAKGMEV